MEEALRGEWSGYTHAKSIAGSAGDEHDQEEEEEEVYGLADAFAQFEARAEARMLKLLEATDRQLFDPAQDEAVVPNAESGDGRADQTATDLPTHIYASDHFRLTKPLQFQHWRSRFSYLEVAGSALLTDESTEHIQFVPADSSVHSSCQDGEHGEGELQIAGQACLQEPMAESQAVYEEIIACDGLMEEVLAEHNTLEDEDDNGNGDNWRRGCPSPLTSQAAEVLDALSLECFTSTVVPSLTSFYQTMLQKQQRAVQFARETREAEAHRTVHERLAMEEAQRRLLEQEALEEAARLEAMEKDRLEEERREAERRELLLKQQIEENDEEEVKIKTLAYSHTREWYQPNKKCFSHRGRQLTYLKPVLQSKESEELMATITLEHPTPTKGNEKRAKNAAARKQTHSAPRHPPRPEWVTGGALTNDRLCNISWLKSSRPPSSPSPPSPRAHSHKPSASRSARADCNQKDSQRTGSQVQLPVISSIRGKPATTTATSTESAGGQSSSPTIVHSTSVSVSNHAVSLYRIPPRVLASDKGEHHRTSHQPVKLRKSKLS